MVRSKWEDRRREEMRMGLRKGRGGERGREMRVRRNRRREMKRSRKEEMRRQKREMKTGVGRARWIGERWSGRLERKRDEDAGEGGERTRDAVPPRDPLNPKILP